MTHFTDLELHRWRDAGPGADNDRVVAHLAVCAACAARYAEAIRSRPLEAADEVVADDAADFVAAGIRARSGATVVPFRRRLRWMVPLAAAALLAIAVAVPRFLREDTESTTPTFRGSGVHALSPSGVVDTAAELVWSSAIAADRYKLEIGDAGGVLYSGEASGTRTATPESVRARLRPGVEYWWTVTALDRAGAAITTSERRTFSLRSP